MPSTLPVTFALGGEGGGCIPSIGFGTFQPEPAPPEEVTEAVLTALKTGYRHIDTAWMYGDGTVERAVGMAIREWGGPREELFVVSKLANAHHNPADISLALELSLTNLGLDYLDLYLMHYPIAYKRVDSPGAEKWKTARHQNGKPVIDIGLTLDYSSTWAAMEDLVTAHKAKYIGVSNFSLPKLRKLIRNSTVKPAVHQIEMHPYLPQREMLEFCQKEGIHVTAHSPLGGRPVQQVALNSNLPGPILDPIIKAIAEKNSELPADILLKWAVQRGTSVVPKSYKSRNIESNFNAIFQRKLLPGEIKEIDNITAGRSFVRFMDPSRYWGFDIFNDDEEEPDMAKLESLQGANQ